MVWLVGILGFVCGFAGGLVLLNRWLKDRSNKDLMQDKSLRSYGVFVWLVAAITSATAVWLYKYYF